MTEKKVYIWGADPQNLRGGPEVLCFLCDSLIRLGVDAKMFNWGYREYNIPPTFSERYKVNVCSYEEVNNAHNEIIVIPELLIQNTDEHVNGFMEALKDNTVMIWYLSTGFTGLLNNIWSNIFSITKTYHNVIHLCESRLAWDNLSFYGITENKFMLQHGTYDIFKDKETTYEKENIVLYNGYKSSTRNFIEKKIIPIIGKDVKFLGIVPEGKFYDKAELCSIMDTCKVYLDFSRFAGRELMPRESALRNCILILGNEGCVCSYEDYPIPSYFKVNLDSPEQICNKIKYCIENYDTVLPQMKHMKNKCLQENDNFRNQLKIIFG